MYFIWIVFSKKKGIDLQQKQTKNEKVHCIVNLILKY